MKTTRHILIAFVVSIFCASQLYAQIPNLEQLRVPSNMGKNFVFAIPPVYEEDTVEINLYALSDIDTRVSVDLVGRGYTFSRSVKKNKISFIKLGNFALPFSFKQNSFLPEQVLSFSSIEVTSAEPIVLYCLVKLRNNSEGFLCLPVESVGNRYIVASMPDMTWMYGGDSKPSVITISATQDNTKVSYTVGGNAVTTTVGGLKVGQTKTWILNKYDVVVIANSKDSKEGDMTGSVVSSDKPVSVVSGNVCANVPTTLRYCNYITEMERPTSSWGMIHLIPNIPFRKNSAMVKIFSAEGNCQILKNGSPNKVIQKSGGVEGTGYIYERVNANKNSVMVYTSNKPTSVTFFNPGSEDDKYPSAPFQMNIIPFEKFSRNYLLSTPALPGNTTFKHHYVSLVYRLTSNNTIPNDFQIGRIVADTIQWQGIANTFGAATGDTFAIKIQDGTYAAKMIELPENGVYYLQSSSPFMAYSFCGDSTLVYGMPSGCLIGENPAFKDTIPPVPTVTESTPVVVRGTVTDEPDDVLVRSNLSSITLSPTNGNAVLVTNLVKSDNMQTANWRVERIDTTQPAQVTITFTDKNGNSTSFKIVMNSTTVTVTPYKPLVKPIIQRSITRSYFCQGETVVLSVPSGYASYTWSNGANAPVLMLSNQQAGTFTYNVVVYDINGDSVRSDDVVIEVRVIPATPLVTYNGSTILSTKEVSGTTYQWQLNNTDIPGATDRVYAALFNGKYRVKITVNGCSSISAEQYVLVSSVEQTEGNMVVISPNPMSTAMLVQYQSEATSTIELVNTLGMVVIAVPVSETGSVHKEISIAEIPKGTYLVRIYSGSTILTTQKLIKE